MKSHIPEEEMAVANGNLQMNLYDLNKQVISQLPGLNSEQLYHARVMISDYMKDCGHTFYMLLCRDVNYYTLFHLVDYIADPEAGAEVLECAACVGQIKSVEETGDGAVEIWVQPEDAEPVAMYLFGYDGGVVECAL